MYQFSIIIPVYNLEKYISICLNSVLKQSFKDFEVIVIDDGSKDNSLEILNQFAKQDARINVIHKENGGAASARNEGLKIAQGEYITFIDGDDMIGEKYLENIQQAIEDTKAEIIMMSLQKSKKDYFEIKEQEKGYILWDKIQAMEEILYQRKVDSGVIGKVFHKNIWDQEKFPEGCLYEDLAILLDLVDKTNKIIYLNYCGYQYTIRQEGTTLKRFNENKMELLEVCKNIEKKFVAQYPTLQKACHYRTLESSFHLFFQAYLIDKNNADKLWKMIKKERWIVLKDEKVKVKTKLASIFSFLGKRLTYHGFQLISKRAFYHKGKL